MNSIKKLLLLMLLILLSAVILLETSINDKHELLLARLEAQTQESVYRVDCGDCDELILSWSNDEGHKYLFLPSSSGKYKKIKEGTWGNDSEITVMRSDKVASMFVVLQNDSLKTVDNNKGYQVPAFVTVINKDGEIEYAKDIEYIKSRGNGSYSTEKKPYEIKLTQPQGLLGMSVAKEWILLSNAFDRSLLKNSLVQDFATNYTELPSAVNRPIDLYIDGEYRGSYLLSEKVQVREGYIDVNDLEMRNEAANGVSYKTEYKQIIEDDISYVAGIQNPKDITGGYLIEMVPEQLLDDSPSFFYTSNGTLFRLKHPRYASKEEVAYIKSIFDEIELAVSTDDGFHPDTGRHYSEIVDVDSWIQKYLLELVFQNGDMSYASMFYYKDSDSINSRLCAGTPWDYDMCLQKTTSTDCFPYLNSMYLREELLQFEEVSNAFEHAYEDVFVPFVQNDLDIYLSQKVHELKSSYTMNAIRWNKHGKTSGYASGYSTLEANADFLSRKLKDSICAMDKWIYENSNYCIVSFSDAYQDFLVKKGEKPNFNTPIYADYISLFEDWKDPEGNIYNEEAVIEKDVVYHASIIDMTKIFCASESELLEMDFSNVNSDLLLKIIDGLRKIQAGNEGALELPTSAINVGGNEEVEIVFLKHDGSVFQAMSVPRGTTLKHIPIPEWEDGIFLKWRRFDNAEQLNESIYMLEPTVYDAEWIYIPYLIENGLAISGKSIEEIDIDMLERVFEKSTK